MALSGVRPPRLPQTALVGWRLHFGREMLTFGTVKDRPLIVVVTSCVATAAAVILFYENMRVPGFREHIALLEAQRDSAIEQVVSQDLDPMVLPETGVHEGQAATTIDGICAIHVERVDRDTATLRITTPFDDLDESIKAVPGDRIVRSVTGATYSVYVLGTRGNMVDVSVYRIGIPKEPQFN